MDDVTQILSRIDRGDPQTAEQLLPLLYGELRELARAKLRNERPDHTLDATALVHEAYVRLVGGQKGETASWDSRGHFFSAAAEAMRRILIESVRHKKARKHGGDLNRIKLQAFSVPAEQLDQRLLALDDTLSHLEDADPTKAQLIKLRVFSGLSKAEAAKALGISARTADRYWNFSRAWLIREMSKT